MSSIFAPLYELFIYDPNYQLIFDQLYEGTGYFIMGIIFIFLPAVIMMTFYWDYKFGYRNPYWGRIAWFIWLILAVIISSVLTYASAYNFIFGSDNAPLNMALNDPNLNYDGYASWLVWMYTIINGIGSAITAFFHSLWLKQFSKLHIHIPF